MRPLVISASCLLFLGPAVACDGDKETDAKEKGDKAKEDEGGEGSADTKNAKSDHDKPRPKKDRGEGSAKLGDKEWVAESARAKLKDGKLRLTLSKTDMTDKAVNRDAFSLVIPDYDGPGEYELKGYSSNFSGVGFDTERAEAAVDKDGKTDDAKVADQAMDTIKEAEIILLSGAKVTITSATETEYMGTFEWKPNGSMANKPPITDGKFRATVRPPKKKD